MPCRAAARKPFVDQLLAVFHLGLLCGVERKLEVEHAAHVGVAVIERQQIEWLIVTRWHDEILRWALAHGLRLRQSIIIVRSGCGGQMRGAAASPLPAPVR